MNDVDNDMPVMSSILGEDESDRPSENPNNNVRYTEVENDFIMNQNVIEGFEPDNNINIPNDNENALYEKNQEENNVQEKKEVQNEVPKMNPSPLFNTKKNTYTLKIIVIGDIAVGKTSVIDRYINNKFSEQHKTTINCEFKKKRIDIDGENEANLQIWDTQGEERFMSVTKQYYNDSHGAILVYDLTQKETFTKMNKWLKDLKNNAPKNIVITIVGNKSDLVNEKVDLGNDLEPFKENYLYQEVSAKSGTNISLVFENLTHKIIEKLKEAKEKGIEDDIPQRNSIPLKKKNSIKKRHRKCGC